MTTARNAYGAVKTLNYVPDPGGDPEPAPDWADYDDMALAWDANQRPGLQALLEELRKDTTTPEWTYDDLRSWLLDDQEKAKSTVEDRIRHLRFMETYAGQPVMLHGTRYQFLLSARLFYAIRKQGGAGQGALSKDLKCMKTMGRFLGIPPTVWPVSPPRIEGPKERIPTPEEVYELLHATWAPDPKGSGAIENAWVRYVLAFHFGLGLRSPKEFWVMQHDAYNPKTGLLRVVEPKKRHKVRLIYVEPTWLAKSRRQLSIEGWLAWRAKMRPTGTSMFPNPLTGEDFRSPEAFKAFLDRRVKQKFPWFHGYLGRHWACYSRIIDAGFADSAYNQVAEWFGHDNVDMTRDTYGPAARAYAKSPQYGTDWLWRAFQQPRRYRPKAQNGH